MRKGEPIHNVQSDAKVARRRDERIQVQLTGAQRRRWEEAAAASAQILVDYIRQHVDAAVERTLAVNQDIHP